MIISRTPLRMSFVGGGSDLPVFYRKYGGAVVSTAIDRYVYITVNKKFDDKIRVSYSRTEEARSIECVKHPLVRETMKLIGVGGGVEITSVADIPSKGSGLGSSSTFTVGLLNALHAFAGRHAGAEQLAGEACEIEIGRCGEPIGKQDQYAAAFGGLNLIRFNEDDSVAVEPIVCRREAIRKWEAHTVVFYTGITRSASAILKHQSAGLATEKKKCDVTKKMASLALVLCGELRKNRVETVGEIIHEGWLLKKSLTDGISTDTIDGWYQKARQAGAIGGKLLGAGTGGFLMFYAPPDRHAAIERALKLRRMKFQFEPFGSRIIFVHQ